MRGSKLSNSSAWISTDLVLENTKYGEDENILLLSGESVDLIEAIAEVAKSVDVFDINFTTLKQLHDYNRNENAHFFDAVFPEKQDYYNTAIIFVPKGREFGRALLWSAMNALKTGGELYIAGANDGGAKSLIKDATVLFGECTVLGYKKSHRVAVSTKKINATYPAEWGELPTEQKLLKLKTALGTIELYTQSGVFSWDELDAGTSFLLENLDLRSAKTALDMGCGYGVIGGLIAPKLDAVTMVDDNLLVVRCVEQSIKQFGWQNAEVIASNLFEELGDRRFDVIISNPPFHQGKDVSLNITEKLISEAPKYLNKGGRLILVVNAFLKYEQVMSETFKQSGIRVQNNKYKILEGEL
jgi:16S rRNA (guanine1207-N2)-methyltransferase